MIYSLFGRGRASFASKHTTALFFSFCIFFMSGFAASALAQCDAGSGGSTGDLIATNPPPPNEIANGTSPQNISDNEDALEALSGRSPGSVHFVERINVGGGQQICVEGVSVDISVNQGGSSGNWKSDQPICFVIVKAGNDNANSGGGVSIYEYGAPDGVGVTEGSWSTSTLGSKDLSHIDFYRCDGVPMQNEGSIQFKKKTVASDGTTLQSTDDGFQFKIESDIVTSLNTDLANPAMSSVFTREAGEDYDVTEVINNSDDWEFVSATCNRSAGDDIIDEENLPISIPDLAAGETVVCTFTNKAKEGVEPDKGSILIEKIAEFGDGEFHFSVTGPGLTNENPVIQTTDGVGFSSVIGDLEAGNYSVTETSLPDDWELVSSICRGLNNETYPADDIDLSPGENVTCTFVNRKKTDDPGEDITKLFIHRRVDNLLTYGPDRARILRRLDQQPGESLKDGGSYEPLKMAGSVKDGQTDVTFSTSLSQIRSAAASAASKKIADAGFSFGDSYSGHTPYALSQRFDLWVEGQIASYDDLTGGYDRDGDFRILYVGMDYAIAPGVLLGGLVQVDHTDEDVSGPDNLTGSVSGTGWMAGPYLGVKLRDDLFFDARAAWGRSSNKIDLDDDVIGPRTGKFDTDRWLATATLTGNYYYGSWRVSPHVGVAYGNEVSDSYLTSLGQTVGSVDATIGRLTFGPEFGYKVMYENGSTFEPHVALKGIWTFDGDEIELSTGTVDIDQFRAQVEGGFIMRSADGYAIRAAGSYDGIGSDDLEAWSGKVWLNVPLN